MIDKKFFPKKLEAKFIGNHQWKLIRSFIYISKLGGKIEAPIDFVSDGASIPRFAWIIVGSPWSGVFPYAAVIHDFLYSKLGKLDNKTYTRYQCDKIFLEAMRVLGVSWWKRRIMYRAVRMWGWIPWRNHAYKKEAKKV